MVDKLEAIKQRFIEVGEKLVQPDLMSDMKNFSKLSKEYKDLEKIVAKYDEYSNIIANIESTKKVLEVEKDQEFREMAKIELDELVPRKDEIEEEIREMLI